MINDSIILPLDSISINLIIDTAGLSPNIYINKLHIMSTNSHNISNNYLPLLLDLYTGQHSGINFLEMNNNVNKVSIYTINGRKIYANIENNNIKDIISKLHNGVYILKINNKITQKISIIK